VTKVVNRVLDILSNKGLLLPEEHVQTSVDRLAPLVKNDKNIPHKHFVIDEIVRTERDYVQHLEILQDFKNEVEESGAIAGDAVHDIFLNLNALLDFQRRFLIRIEQQNSLPEDQQNWGQLFIQYKESFRVYEPFIANQIRCNNAVTKEWDKLKAAPLSEDLRGMVEIQSILTGFLMKPFQRLSKYPMLLDVRFQRSLLS
jgi:cell division control protein 24